jgi:MFS family permease
LYRWVLVVALAVMVNVGYGTIFYSFSVLLGEGAAAGEFSRTTLSAALGLAVVVSGLLALPVGTVCDVLGPRRVFLAGAALGCAGLAAFSQAMAGWQVLLVWALLLGPAMACSFYEPAYVAIDQWFEGPQGRALGVLTVVAGLSVAIFLPLSQALVDRGGWRFAVLALGATMLVVNGALALLVVRDRPRRAARLREAGLGSAYAAMLEGLRNTNAAFWTICAAFTLGFAATFAMLFHQVAYLQDLGFPPAQVAAAVGVIGFVSLPGRFLLPALGDHVSPSRLAAGVFLVLGVSALVLLGAREWWRVYLYIALFGLVFGTVLPVRAVVMSRHFSGALYGRLMGLQAAILALATAGGPFLAGLLRDLTGAYTLPWLAAVALLALAVPAILLVGDPPKERGEAYN